MDYLTIEAPKGEKDVNILVVTDHFTRYSQAYVTPNQTAQTTAQTLWDKFFVHYGFPEKLISDQGKQFEGKLIEELCKITNVKKLRTTPYHPQTNGQCERFNQTLISMLGTLSEKAKSKWPSHVATLTHAYNCTKCMATGYSPYFLMYGRHPMLPIDHRFNVYCPDMVAVSPKSYARKLKERLAWAYEQAYRIAAKNSARSKELYDNNVKQAALEQGDLVLLRQKAFKGKHKLKNRWENRVYKVQERIGSSPIYKIRDAEDDNAKVRVYHRNMMYPLLTRQRDELQLKDTLEQVDPALNTDSESESDAESLFESADEEIETLGPITRSRARKMQEEAQNKCMYGNTEPPVVDVLVIPALGLHSMFESARAAATQLAHWANK